MRNVEVIPSGLLCLSYKLMTLYSIVNIMFKYCKQMFFSANTGMKY